MGDHLVLLMDRLITESTLDAVIERRNQAQTPSPSTVVVETEFSYNRKICADPSTPPKLVECRICQDEDEDSNMESPCSCSGSLKYAHRKCIQRWCNEKGDTICEICQQEFKPGYTAPPQLFQYGGIPMNFRGNWEISRRDIHNSRFIAMVATDRDFLGPDYDDYSSTNTRSLVCCRTVAAIFMLLLVLRHILPVILLGTDESSLTLLVLLLLRTAGVLLPIYVLARAFAAIQRRRNQREARELSLATGELEQPQVHLQSQPHLIHVH
ncbi:hypothetical protein H6P81_009032 [Aristolochia fimbriata]|uniref:RING-CH-type domain-containing protein n=1 Tax=Aristolochia fimbriata TaxID=158543 RepID=A0AAV7EN65_ARIFI|nr:hypothetical protein H6P81_009032 [Aristolochia fimbriata]